RLFWLDTQRREYRPDDRNFQDLKVVESPDGIAWGEPRTVIRWELDQDPFYVSPAVVRAGDGSHRVYVVQPRSATIPWMPIPPDAPDASDRPAPPPGGRLEYGLEGVRPWHVDVFPGPEGWVALLCARPPDATGPDDTDLWVGGSRDLEHWRFSAEPTLVGGDPELGVELVYRSSGLIENDRLVIWYSGRTADGEWRLGVATLPASTVPFPD
ncbi:MAG: hypothetical protein KC591_13925, partial [Gemmatimonadetes bacterium]|nr:hypothetical protein [Gemmatimonadota bacterium]